MRSVSVASLLLLLLPLGASAQPASPATLRGVITDGPTGVPIPNAVVRVGDAVTFSNELGAYELALPLRDLRTPSVEETLEVYTVLPNWGLEALHQTGLVFAPGAATTRDITLVTGAFLDDWPMLEDGLGVPRAHRDPEALDISEPIDLFEVWLERRHPDGPTLEDLRHLELPDVLPATIRVLRRYPNSCSGTDYPISSVDLDTYAAGVVTAEIGVFRALTTGQDTQLEGFKALAIAGRTYALWFWANNPDAAWHLDDTACNQRYTDGPYPDIIDEAAQATSGQILVQTGTGATIDKFEYAASCGRCGSQPEYQTELVPDETGQVACTTGGWCGHNNCAAHADNPACPLENANVRCLVRGICQWGLAERSARGDTYDAILGHYQPNLDIRDFNALTPGRLLGYVRVGSIETGEGVAGAVVTLDTGEQSVTAGNGLFTFDAVEPGLRTLSVRASGYADLDGADVEVLEGIDNWLSVALTPVPADAGPPDTAPDAGPPDLSGDGATPDGGGPPDAGSDASDAGSDPEEGDAVSPAAPFSRFAVVGPEGLDEGCGCHALAADPPRPAGPLAVLLFGSALWIRARSRRTRRHRC